MKRTFSTFLFLLLIFQVMAGPVSRHDAMKSAQHFLNKRGIKASALKECSHAPLTRAAEGSEGTAYYVFNVGNNGGFVIVSGDDRTDAVLGYSTSGEFDETTIPDNMRAWLQGYADQISSTRSYTRASDSIEFHDPIKPLLTTKWGQDKPYNLKTPRHENSLCATGCAATAMAQVMNYYRYPKDLPAIEGYTTTTLKLSIDALPGVTDFNWDALKAAYSNEDKDENIAALMLYCGQSMHIDYTPDGSAALEYKPADILCNVFNYASAENAWRSQYSAKGWDEMIYNELFNNRPVLYYGDSSVGGHAFVCDGYDGFGYFHINWGWSGNKDSYFLLNALNSDGEGTGTSLSDQGMNFIQTALINVKTIETSEFEVKTGYDYFKYKQENNEFVIDYRNNLFKTYTFDLGVGYLSDDAIVFFKHIASYELAPDQTVSKKLPISIFNELPDGTYKIVPISKECDTETWFDCRKNDDIYAEIEVVDGVATFLTMNPKEDFEIDVDITGTLFAKCFNKINVTITNNHSEDIQKNVRLYYKKSGDKDSNKEDTILPLKAKAGESATGYFLFSPPSSGDYLIEIRNYDDNSEILCKEEVTVEEPLSEHYEDTVSNPRFKFGSSASFLVDVTNNDIFDHPGRKVTVTLYCQDEESKSDSTYVVYESVLDAIPAGKTVTLSFNIANCLTKVWTEFQASASNVVYIFNNATKDTSIHEINVPHTKLYIAELGTLGYASFAKPEALDFSECDDLEAYTGKVDNNKEYVVMTKHEQVPANTGLVLKGTPYRRYAVRVIESAEEIPDNDLVAVTEDKPVDADSVLTFKSADGNVGFYNFAETFLKAGQSYLSKTKTGDVSYLRLQFGSDPSAIRNIHDDKQIFPSATYNLEGQKVDENYKGIVIRNGKIFLAR